MNRRDFIQKNCSGMAGFTSLQMASPNIMFRNLTPTNEESTSENKIKRGIVKISLSPILLHDFALSSLTHLRSVGVILAATGSTPLLYISFLLRQK